MARAAASQCIALTDVGVRCSLDTGDSTRLCQRHRESMQRLLEVELLHCHDCPLLVRGPGGAPDRDATLARCTFAFKYARKGEPTGNSPCHYEVVDFFSPLQEKDDFVRAMEVAVGAETRLLKRALRFQTDPGRPVGEVLRLSDQVMRHVEQLATFAGVYRPPPRTSVSLPVPEDQRAGLLDALMHGGEPVEDRGAARGLEGDLAEPALAEGDTAVSQAPPRAPRHIKGLMKDEA